MHTLFATTAVALLTLSGAAMAQTVASASTELNVRSGPGVQYPVIGSIVAGSDVSVLGCIDSANWCEIQTPGIAGWAYGDYLTVSAGDQIVSLYPNRQTVGVTVIEPPVVDPQTVNENAAVGGLGGAAMGALIGGPVGLVAGAILGGSAGTVAAYEPTADTTTYVTTNVVEPIYLDGEVVIGAGVPETVTVYDIPTQPEYRYAQINGQTVLVDPLDRRIVYIYR